MYLSNLRGCYVPGAKNIFYLTKKKSISVERVHNSKAKEMKERRIQIVIRIALTSGTKQEVSF